MRIGIDCRKIYDVQKNEGAGVARYIFHLVKNLLAIDQNNEYVLFCHGDLGHETIHKVRGGNARVKIVKVQRAESRIPFWPNHVRFASVLRKEKLDWVIFPANIIPLFYRGRSLVVIHDLAIYQHPEWFPGRQWFARQVLVPRSVRRAAAVVCVSENTKKDLLAIFRVKEEKVFAIYPGVAVKADYLPEETNNVLEKYGITDGYVLYLGTIEPRKNILNLIKAFSAFIFENEEAKVKLVIAGARGWKYQPVLDELGESNRRLVSSRIKYVGKVSNRERNILLKNCLAFIYPSYYEGFGFPVAEAMALGVPVITSDNSSLREIVADAAVLIDPDDTTALRRALKAVLNDKVLRYQLISRGQERVKLFDWRVSAAKILKIIQ